MALKGKGPLVALALVLVLIVLVIAGMLVFLIVRANTSFLLVETDRQWRTELVSGNYTGNHICFDFPTYYLDKEGKMLEDWRNSKQRGFKLAYCSSSAAWGLLDSGGASGVDYIRDLPFTEEEAVPWGVSSFNITVTVDEDLSVFINGSERLLKGESKLYRFDQVIEYSYQDRDTRENRTCLVRFVQNTTVTNYGIWRLSQIEFGYEKEPYWWPGSLAYGEDRKGHKAHL